MEKESLAQSTARDRATTSVVIDGIAIDPEERGHVLGTHHVCVRTVASGGLGASDGGPAAGYTVAIIGVAQVVGSDAHVALELVSNDQADEHFEIMRASLGDRGLGYYILLPCG
jgi:hypothetical protein